MSRFYGILAVMGWAWTVLVALFLIVRFRRDAARARSAVVVQTVVARDSLATSDTKIERHEDHG
jgi:hypothetical protein